VALPLALAFGVSSGAGAVAGLYGAILVGFFASLFGGTPQIRPDHYYPTRLEALRHAAYIAGSKHPDDRPPA